MPIDDWNADAVIAAARRQMARRLTAAALLVENHAKQLLSLAGTAPRGKGQARQYGATRSAPGEPPRKQTGRLRASVTHEVHPTDLTAHVGTNVQYGRYLELGTSRIAPRPWLRRALAERTAQIQALLGAR